jgi:integrase
LSRFLLVTGWRRGEAIGLRGSDLDLPRRTATLGETKTGRSVRPLSTAAVKLLRSAATKPDALVFPASRGTGLMTGYPKFWRRILKPAELSADVTPHTLRHSFASLAADMGYSEPTIAALIGHAGRSMTSRYVHSADAVLLAAADAVARRTLKLAGDLEGGVVVPMRAGG